MAKVRVYELAKELGIESKVVMTKLQEMGEFVRSASSTVEAPVVRKLRAEMPAAPPAPAPAVKKAAAPAPVEAAPVAAPTVAPADERPAGPTPGPRPAPAATDGGRAGTVVASSGASGRIVNFTHNWSGTTYTVEFAPEPGATLTVIGVTLVAATLVIPAVVTRMLTTRFTRMLWLSSLIGALCGFIGMNLSYHLDVPSGTMIVLTGAALFGVVLALTGGRRLGRPTLSGRTGRTRAASTTRIDDAPVLE